MPGFIESRFTTAIRRLLNLKTELPLGDVVSPTLDIGATEPHNYFLRDERLLMFTQRSVAAGGAGTWARVIFGNPAGSGRLIVFESVFILKLTSGTPFAVVGGFGGGGVLAAVTPRDSRLYPGGVGPVSTPYLALEDTPAVQPGPGIPLPVPTANVWTACPLGGVVVTPGFALTVQTNTANEALAYALLGFDVPLHGGELD